MPTTEQLKDWLVGRRQALQGLAAAMAAASATIETIDASLTVLADELDATLPEPVPTPTPTPVPHANCFSMAGPETVVVDSMEELENAVNTATVGRVIQIAPGSYNGGALHFKGRGNPGFPIIVWPKDGMNTVTIKNPRWVFDDRSAWLVFGALTFEGSFIILRGDHHRITRLRFRKIGSPTFRTESVRDCRIDHCDFSDLVAAAPCINIRPNFFESGTAAHLLIDHCYFHDLEAVASAAVEVIQSHAGGGWPDLPADTVIIDHCLFERLRLAPGEGEILPMKMGGWTVRFSTFNDCPGMYVPAGRVAANTEIRSCWFEGMRSDPLMVRGPNNLVIGNRFVGDLDMGVWAGNESWADSLSDAGSAGYAPCTGSRIIGNQMGSGHIVVGTYWGSNTTPGVSLAANNNVLEANERDSGGEPYQLLPSIHGLKPAHRNTKINATTLEPFTPALKLTAADVGLNADDPFCR